MLAIGNKLIRAVVGVIIFLAALATIATYLETSEKWPEVTAVISSYASPELFTLVYRLLLLSAFALGLWWLNRRIGILEEARSLQSQVAGQATTSPSEVFAIEQLEWEIGFRDKRGATLPPLHPELPPAPDDAIMVLSIMVRITAIPARVVEDIILSIAGNRIHLHPGQWRRHHVSSREQYLSFDIPQFIEPAYHKVQLIMEGEGGAEVKSAVFRVPLTRSYIPPEERR